MEKQNTNKGFSLVELLVSIVILCIIMIPILDNILVSTRMNMKSRDTEDATILASNLMESLKSENDFTALAADLLYHNGEGYLSMVGEGGLTISQVEEKDGTYKNASALCVEKDADDGEYQFTENEDRTYHFGITNLTYNDTLYDAVITYDAKTYEQTVDESGEETDSINKEDIPVIQSVSTDTNAVITQGYSDKWAETTLKHSYNEWFSTYRSGENNVDNEEIAENTDRTFYISVNYDSISMKYVVEVKIVYELSNSLIPDIGGSGSDTYAAYRTYENTIYKKEFTSLNNVYLFYIPNLTRKSDVIYFTNNLSEEKAGIKFYLVEQNQEEACPNYSALMAEYRLEFFISEANAKKKAGSGVIYNTIFKTNLGNTLTGMQPMIIKNIGLQDELTEESFIEMEEDKARLYEVTVDLYRCDGTNHYKESNLVTSLTSTQEVK